MPPVETYNQIEVQAQDCKAGDVWVIPCILTGFAVRASYKDPREGKPFWLLEGKEGGLKVQSLHLPTTMLEVMRPDPTDPGEFVDEDEESWIEDKYRAKGPTLAFEGVPVHRVGDGWCGSCGKDVPEGRGTREKPDCEDCERWYLDNPLPTKLEDNDND